MTEDQETSIEMDYNSGRDPRGRIRTLAEALQPWATAPMEPTEQREENSDPDAMRPTWRTIATDQRALADDLRQFENDVAAFAQMTPYVTSRLMERLARARDAMSRAFVALNEGKPRTAQLAQESVLLLLREGEDDLRTASRSLSASSTRRDGQRGFRTRGFRQGAVRLPRTEDHRPSRVFREEILDSLKERYPKDDERLIEEYFKNWSR
jgi:hypothetical protein